MQATSADGVSERVTGFYKDQAISADSFSRCVISAMSQPEDVDINEIPYRPTRQE